MTLVAAYKHRNTPVLVGDIAISKNAGRSLRKKAYVISPNLAIAWAGHMIVAKTVIASLRAQFCNVLSTRKSVEQFFRSHKSDDFGALQTVFIGWIVEGDNHFCFLWNCQHPMEVFYGNEHFEGTGELYFNNLRAEKWDVGDSGLPHDDALVLSAINRIAQARFEESLYRDTWDLSFGISYDVILWLTGRFRYVGSIVYIGWDYHWDLKKQCGSLEQAPVILKHTCFGDYSVLQETLQGQHFNGTTTNYLSRPVFDDMPHANFSDFCFQPSMESDYFANYFLFRSGGKVVFRTLLTVQQRTGEGPLKVERRNNGAYFFRFDTDELNRITTVRLRIEQSQLVRQIEDLRYAGQLCKGLLQRHFLEQRYREDL